MDILLDFEKLYGTDITEQIFDYLLENGIYDEFFDCYNDYNNCDYNKLFKFALQYGIYDIVEYLYIHKNIPYDVKIFDEFYTNITSNNDDPNKVSMTTEGIHNGLHVSKMDKYTKNRNYCINYLLNLKKYSTYKYVNNKHIYCFNKKYLNQCIN